MTAVSKLVVGSTFPIYPPRGGGQLRIFRLYQELSRDCPVDVVTLVEHGQPEGTRMLDSSLREVRIAKTAEHHEAEAATFGQVGIPVTDVAFVELHSRTPAFSRAVARCAEPGCILVASHPYALPAMRAARAEGEWWYDAHNVEADLKASMLRATRAGRRLHAQVKSVERDCCRQSSVVLATCREDALRLGQLYRVPPERLRIVPNGVDAASIPFIAPSERKVWRSRFRLKQPTALFIGSWHEPNLLAARAIIALAAELPEVTFLIAGSVGIPLAGEPCPSNVQLFGPVTDQLKESLLGTAEVALNPVIHGSGTNMKMLDYLSAGVPVISTPVGIRGLDLRAGEEVRVIPLERFEEGIRAILAEPPEQADARARQVRARIERRFAWSAVASEVRTLLAERSPRVAQPAGAGSATSA